MPRYFFHLRDGTDILLDEEGSELDGLEAIAAAALMEARSIIGADAQEGRLMLDQRIDVVDAAGALIHSLQFVDAVTITLPEGQA